MAERGQHQDQHANGVPYAQQALSWLKASKAEPHSTMERVLESFVYRPVLLRLERDVGKQRAVQRLATVLKMADTSAGGGL